MIVQAISNDYVFQKIKEKYLDDVYEHEITYMEGVIEFLSSNKEYDIIVTKDNLPGNLSKEMYVKQLKLANENCKIMPLMKTEQRS